MLKALGFADEEIPTLLVHGWWNIAGAKMSKSLGNVIDPGLLADQYGAEAVRYYLVSDIATGKDADFSEERLIQRYNTDLANSLGNLLNRTLSMAAKYRGGRVISGEFDDQYLKDHRKNLAGAVVEYREAMSEPGLHNTGVPRINDALAYLRIIGAYSDGMVDAKKPWALAKDPTQAEQLDAVLYTLAESLRIIAILLSPVLPQAAQGLFDQLNWKMDEQGQETRFRLADATWGGLPDGHPLGQPTPLFPRIEVPAGGHPH